MRKLISLFVFLSISSSVLFGSTLVIQKSVSEKPNYAVVAEIIHNYTNKTTQAIAIDSDAPSDTVLGAATSLDKTDNSTNASNCAGSLVFQQKSQRSLIDFLMSEKIDYHFESRVILAKDFGIENYVGNKDQNRQLLNLLLTKILCHQSTQ